MAVIGSGLTLYKYCSTYVMKFRTTMARLSSPLLSFEVSGLVGPLSYGRASCRGVLSRWFRPGAGGKVEQQKQRGRLALASYNWKHGPLTERDKQAWVVLAAAHQDKRLTGQTAFIQEWLAAEASGRTFVTISNGHVRRSADRHFMFSVQCDTGVPTCGGSNRGFTWDGQKSMTPVADVWFGEMDCPAEWKSFYVKVTVLSDLWRGVSGCYGKSLSSWPVGSDG